MSSEENKRLVERFCQDHSSRNLDALYGYAVDGARWWVSGRPDLFPHGGDHDYKWLVDQLKWFLGGFESWSFDIVALVAEGDRVILEATGRGKGPGHKEYNNNYVKHFTFSNGLIANIREYHDALEFMHYSMPEGSRVQLERLTRDALIDE